jgi:hypothetical protein
VNDEKKDTNPVAGGDPNADDNPWDDDDGSGRTLATDGPSFEMPSNIPSPITVPPPPADPQVAPPKSPAKSTLVGLMPADFLASVARRRGSAPDAPMAPPPMVLADDDLAELPGHQEDGPTMAIASPQLANRPLRDDVVAPREAPRPGAGFSPPRPMVDKDAETMAVGGDDPRLPPRRLDPEETTRAVSRDEMMRHRDAQVVVGEDAIGDDATLAIAPGQIDRALMPSAETLGPPLAAAPHFPQGVPSGSSGHLRAAPQHQMPYAPPGAQQPSHVPPWQGGAAQPSYGNPAHGGFDPLMPQGHPGMHGGPFPQTSPMAWGPSPNAPTAYNAGPMGNPPMGMQQPQGMMQMQAAPPAPWMPQQQPPPEGGGPIAFGIRFTPQIMLLAGVGVVCLAIFVIGIVLFVTTKF